MSTAKRIGERCRKFRNALGVSQQALADQVGTTPQNISKYEKEGVYNIETIQALSQVLGHDLLSDEMENEGDVGEIGRELLCAMIGYKFPFHSTEYGLGYIYTKDLFEQNVMYGLDENRIVREIFKLEKLGLCVREQYTDFYGEQIDRVFITAKGAITIKHIINSDEILSYLDDIVTYEIICGKYSSYQEYIDNNVLEKKIRNLPMNSSFRANYIHFLHRNFEKGLDCYRLDMNMSPCFFSGRNCYYDIMYHMIIDFDLTQSDSYWRLINEFDGYDEIDEIYEESLGMDVEKYKAGIYLKRDIPILSENSTEDNEFEIKESELDKFMLNNPEERFRKQKEKHANMNPLEWFTNEEIEKFVDNNILPAQNDYEEKIEKELIEIMLMEPMTTEDYFVFPQEWENNGLADKIKSIYKVPKYQ